MAEWRRSFTVWMIVPQWRLLVRADFLPGLARDRPMRRKQRVLFSELGSMISQMRRFQWKPAFLRPSSICSCAVCVPNCEANSSASRSGAIRIAALRSRSASVRLSNCAYAAAKTDRPVTWVLRRRKHPARRSPRALQGDGGWRCCHSVRACQEDRSV
jgi:hypothetical protein